MNWKKEETFPPITTVRELVSNQDISSWSSWTAYEPKNRRKKSKTTQKEKVQYLKADFLQRVILLQRQAHLHIPFAARPSSKEPRLLHVKSELVLVFYFAANLVN